LVKRLVVACVLIVLAAASAEANPGASWKITKDHWSPDDEKRFGEFVIGFGEHDCKDPAACFKSTANPYRDSDPPNLRMDGDCADFIYQLRAYFAWKNGLPFSYPLYVMSRSGPTDDFRFSDSGNMIVARLQLEWQPEADPVRLLLDLRGTVSTAMFRVEHIYDRGFSASDFYSPRIERGAIRPGSIIYDPYGHVVYVYKIDDDGTIHYVDSNPDREVTRGKFGAQFPRTAPAIGAGFWNWRPMKLVEYTTMPDGSLVNGRFVVASNAELPDYSTVQYFGTETNDAKDWKNAKFTHAGQTLGYYDYVKAKLAK
jgi:surface antigen